MFKKALKTLKSSKVYKSWINDHQDSYLSYGFIMIDPNIEQEWQIGFYNPGNDTITTFSISKEIMQNPESDIFKDSKKVRELNLNDIKINLNKAIDSAEQLQKKKYFMHTPVKKIVLIQNLDIGQVWNITFVTDTFKTLNIKVNSNTGDIVKHDLIELFRT